MSFKETIKDIAGKNETPFYIFLEANILKAYRDILDAFNKGLNTCVFYSVKTNYEIEILKVFKNLGCGVEISSMLDLHAVKRAGFNPSQIIADGFLKSNEFLKKIIDIRINTINAESLSELVTINNISAAQQVVSNIGIRFKFPVSINPRNLLIGFFKKTFYNFGIGEEEIEKNILIIKKLRNINIDTVMIHNVSPYLDAKDFIRMLRFLFAQAYKLRRNGIRISKINMGGNLPLIPCGNYKACNEFTSQLNVIYRNLSSKYGVTPSLILEPGKALIDNAGFLVGRIMDVQGKWIITDLSQSDYGFNFPFRRRKIELLSLNDNSSKAAKNKRYYIKANNLSQFDVFGSIKSSLDKCKKGNLILMHNVGAYSLAFSYQFIRPRLPIYMLGAKGGLSILRAKEECKEVLRI